MVTGQEYLTAINDFRRARNRAKIEELISHLRGESTELLSYNEVRRALRLSGGVQRGLMDIPLEKIVGSVGRYNDFTRQDHQTMVLCALKEKLLSPSVLPKIPEIAAAFKDSVITDLSLEQMSQLACLLPKLDRDTLLFSSFPDDLFTPTRVFNPQMGDNTFVMEYEMDVMEEYIQKFLEGTWPLPDEEQGNTCP